MPRVIHAHARTFHDREWFRFRRRGDVKIVAQQIVPVQPPVNLHRLAKEAGAAGPARHIAHRLKGAQQHSGGMTFAFCHHVHAVIHPVDEIDIGAARRTKHNLVSFGQAFG